MRNMAYYIGEAGALLSQNKGRTALALLSVAVLLLFSMSVGTAYIAGDYYATMLASESEIAVFYDFPEKLSELEMLLARVEGVQNIRRVSEEEALAEMKEYLGAEARILERFTENPLEAYLRVRVSPTISAASLDEVAALPGVSHVRDHREVLDKVGTMTASVAVAGVVVGVATILTSALMTYFVSSEMVAARREQIEDMLLMGAPKHFVAIPFLLQSLVLNLVSGGLAALGYFFAVDYFELWYIHFLQYVMIGFPALAVLVGFVSTLMTLKTKTVPS